MVHDGKRPVPKFTRTCTRASLQPSCPPPASRAHVSPPQSSLPVPSGSPIPPRCVVSSVVALRGGGTGTIHRMPCFRGQTLRRPSSRRSWHCLLRRSDHWLCEVQGRLTSEDKSQASNTGTGSNSRDESLSSARRVGNVCKVVRLNHGYSLRECRPRIGGCRSILAAGRGLVLLYGFRPDMQCLFSGLGLPIVLI